MSNTSMYSVSSPTINVYASTSALGAVDMSLQFDGVRAMVTDTGLYQYAKQAITGDVAATGGGYWNLSKSIPTLLLNANNEIDGSMIASTGVISLPNGSAAAPSIYWDNSTTMGFYRVAANDLGIATNGVLRFDVSTTNVTSTLPLAIPAGSAAAPSIAVGGEQTGPYLVGAGSYGVSVAGTLKLNLTATALNMATGVALQIATVQVVGPRNTGWTTSAGTATKNQGAINADTITATDGNMQLVTKWLKGVTDALITHGLLGA